MMMDDDGWGEGDKICRFLHDVICAWLLIKKICQVTNLSLSAAAIIPVQEKSKNKLYCHTIAFCSCSKF